MRWILCFFLLVSAIGARAAEWNCYPAIAKGGQVYIGLDPTHPAIHNDLVIPANEKADDVLAAFSGNKICLKGRTFPVQGSPFLAYDASTVVP